MFRDLQRNTENFIFYSYLFLHKKVVFQRDTRRYKEIFQNFWQDMLVMQSINIKNTMDWKILLMTESNRVALMKRYILRR